MAAVKVLDDASPVMPSGSWVSKDLGRFDGKDEAVTRARD